jgi:hypothetical protein
MFFDILVLYCTVADDKDTLEERDPLLRGRYGDRYGDRYYELDDYESQRRYQTYDPSRRSTRSRMRQPAYDDGMEDADDTEVAERLPSRYGGGERSTSRVYESGLSGRMEERGQSKMRAGGPATSSRQGTATKLAPKTPQQSKVSPLHKRVDSGMSGQMVEPTVPSRSQSKMGSRAPSAIRGGGASDEPRGRDRRVKEVGEAKIAGSEELDEVDELMRRYAGANYK